MNPRGQERERQTSERGPFGRYYSGPMGTPDTSPGTLPVQNPVIGRLLGHTLDPPPKVGAVGSENISLRKGSSVRQRYTEPLSVSQQYRLRYKIENSSTKYMSTKSTSLSLLFSSRGNRELPHHLRWYRTEVVGDVSCDGHRGSASHTTQKTFDPTNRGTCSGSRRDTELKTWILMSWGRIPTTSLMFDYREIPQGP